MAKIWLCAALLGLVAIGSADQDLRLGGSVETAFISAKRNGELTTGNRYTRSQLTAEQGPWRAEATWWSYPFCDFHELDETSVQYTGSDWSAVVGRWRLPIGQHSWDEQWYSPFIFLARLEMQNYEGGLRLSHTSPGYLLEHWSGLDQFTLGLTSSSSHRSSFLPDLVNRAAVRWQRYVDPFIIGVSALVDPSEIGKDETMTSLDVRWSQPNWMARAVLLNRRSDGTTFTDYDGAIISTAGRQESLFVDVTFRPPGITNAQLGARWDLWRNVSGGSQSEVTTLAARLSLPYGIDASINYTLGPGMSSQPLGGGWAFQLLKIHRF